MNNEADTSQARYSQSPEADATMAGDRAAIFHRGTRVAITLNPTGTLLWNSLTTPKSADEMVADLSSRFSTVAQEQLRRDVEAFITELSSHNLLQTH